MIRINLLPGRQRYVPGHSGAWGNCPEKGWLVFGGNWMKIKDQPHAIIVTGDDEVTIMKCLRCKRLIWMSGRGIDGPY